MKYTIFLPCLNEEDNLKRIPKELIDVLKKDNIKDYEILIIDDGSTDNSIAVAEMLMKKHKQIRLVKHGRNKGLGEAVKTGIAHAKGEFMIMLDSDFTLHPNQIKSFIDKYDKTKADCISGSPYLHKNGLKNLPIHRIFISKVVNMIYHYLLTKNITALTPIMRLYKTEQLRELGLRSSDYNICAEIIIKLILRKKKVVEIPVVLTTRTLGVSKINFKKEIKNHLKLIMSLIKYRILRMLGFKVLYK